MNNRCESWLDWLPVVGLALCVQGLPAITSAQQDILEARKVTSGPMLDGKMKPAYEQAKPLTFKVNGGRNIRSGYTMVTLRALYDAQNIYFLAQWNDPTNSERWLPFQKQPGGSWRRLADPTDRGGDNNLYYEDKFAMMWAVNSPAIERLGCFAGCHLGEGKPYGNMYLPAGELADLWQWGLVSTGSVGQMANLYLDDSKYNREKAPDAGLKSDKAESGGFIDNPLVNGKPQWALPGNQPAPPYWILNSEKVPLDDSQYKPGDEVPGIIVAPFVGDRGSISCRSSRQSGGWTLEWTRKLTTGSPTDIQFNDLNKRYAFGVAVFDNAEVRHAYNAGVLWLAFEK